MVHGDYHSIQINFIAKQKLILSYAKDLQLFLYKFDAFLFDFFGKVIAFFDN